MALLVRMAAFIFVFLGGTSASFSQEGGLRVNPTCSTPARVNGTKQEKIYVDFEKCLTSSTFFIFDLEDESLISYSLRELKDIYQLRFGYAGQYGDIYLPPGCHIALPSLTFNSSDRQIYEISLFSDDIASGAFIKDAGEAVATTYVNIGNPSAGARCEIVEEVQLKRGATKADGYYDSGNDQPPAIQSQLFKRGDPAFVSFGPTRFSLVDLRLETASDLLSRPENSKDEVILYGYSYTEFCCSQISYDQIRFDVSDGTIQNLGSKTVIRRDHASTIEVIYNKPFNGDDQMFKMAKKVALYGKKEVQTVKIVGKIMIYSNTVDKIYFKAKSIEILE